MALFLCLFCFLQQFAQRSLKVSILLRCTLGKSLCASAAAANLCGLWFPDSLETIGEGALARFSALAFVRFGANLREIQPFAFYSCSELRELDFRATRLETIDDDAFFGCSSVVSLFFPATLRSIGSSAFSGWS